MLHVTEKAANKIRLVNCVGCGAKVAPWNTYCVECLHEAEERLVVED